MLNYSGLHCTAPHKNFCTTALSWELGNICNPSSQAALLKMLTIAPTDTISTQMLTYILNLTRSQNSQMITSVAVQKMLLPWRRMYKTTGKTTESVHHHPSLGHRISPHPRLSLECWTIHGMTPHQ